jgi:hypothetical protein
MHLALLAVALVKHRIGVHSSALAVIKLARSCDLLRRMLTPDRIRIMR